MNKNTKNILLVVVVIIIGVSIWYLSATKPTKNAADIKDIVVGETTVTPGDSTSTPSTNSSATSTKTIPLQNRTAIRNQKASVYPRAKELAGIQGYINTPQGFKLSDVVGKKVVLIDFWTYSCINCQRTTPYLNAWYQKYKDQGLEIVGVHSPEFDFEKKYENVAQAVKQLGIKYPVVLDSAMATWAAYQNQYWPREYLIDIDGFIVHDHIGEGKYDETEQAIQKALQERQAALGLKNTIDTSIANPKDVIQLDAGKVASPETYFGSARNQYLSNGTPATNGSQVLTIPNSISANALYLDGTWNFAPEYAETTSGSAKIELKYNSKNVYFVGSSLNGVTLKVYSDGKLVNTVPVKDNKLYTLVQGAEYASHTLLIEVEGAGLDAFTFTFG
jgi:thiol-disulfide isomerase/thioredoxin